jgi:hypothetical protein
VVEPTDLPSENMPQYSTLEKEAISIRKKKKMNERPFLSLNLGI